MQTRDVTQAVKHGILHSLNPLTPYTHAARHAREFVSNLAAMGGQVVNTAQAMRQPERGALPGDLREQALRIADTRARFEHVAESLGRTEQDIKALIRQTRAQQYVWLVMFVLSLFALSITTNLGLLGFPLSSGCTVIAVASIARAFLCATNRTVLQERNCLTPRDMWSRRDMFTKWLMPWA